MVHLKDVVPPKAYVSFGYVPLKHPSVKVSTIQTLTINTTLTLSTETSFFKQRHHSLRVIGVDC